MAPRVLYSPPAARRRLGLLAGIAVAALLALAAVRPGAAMVAVLHVSGGTPGTAGDASAATYSFAADDSARALTGSDGTAIAAGDVPAVYGTSAGMTVRAGGVDVASAGYTGPGGPKRAVGRDLSNGTGWPATGANPGELAIDPATGRLSFFPGGVPAVAGVDDIVVATQKTIGVALYGHYAYVSDRVRMIDVFDISDPANPHWVGNAAYASGNGEALTVAGDKLYLSTKSGGMVIYSLANPAAPVALGHQLPPADAPLCKGVFVQGNYAYVADEKGGVLIVDVSNPAHPFQAAALARYSESVWVVGRYVYVAGGTEGVRIFDVPNPARPIGGHIGALATGGNSFGIQVQGNYAYVADGPGGLKILDISNPYSPVLVGQHRVGPNPSQDSPAYGVTVSGSLAYVTGFLGVGCLNVFDVSDPAHPTLLKALALSAPAYSAAPSGPFVYVGNDSVGLSVVVPGFSEAPTAPVTVDYSYLDPNATPTVTSTPTATATPTSTPTITPTWDPSARAGLVGKVSYQGRGAEGDARWAAPLTVTLQVSGSLAPPMTLATRADVRGTFTVTELVPGNYVVRVRDNHSLFNRRQASLGLGLNPTDLGLLLEGDANADNAVNLYDFSILSAAYRKTAGQAGFDARADFNDDGTVNLYDFSLLSGNYRRSGDALPDAGARATAGTATLSLLPASSHIQPGENLALDLQLDTGGGQADALAARVHYDPRYLTFVEVQLEPGLTVLTSGIDPINGIYEAELGVLDGGPLSGQVHVARLVLQAQGATPAAGTTVQLVPAGTAVLFEGGSVLAGTSDAQVFVGTPLRYLWLPRVVSK